MAEQYTQGLQRIFYRPAGFKKGLTVTAKLSYSTLEEIVDIKLFETDVFPGLYYFDYDFVQKGIYVVYFYENGEVKGSQVFNINEDYEDTFAGRKGRSVV